MIGSLRSRLGFLLTAVVTTATATAATGAVAAATNASHESVTTSAVTATRLEPPSVEAFFRRPSYDQPRLSPSGRFLALVAPVGERLGLGVIDLDARRAGSGSGETMKPPDGDILDAHWLDDERLILTLGPLHRAAGDSPARVEFVAINRDGGDEQLIRVCCRGPMRLIGRIAGSKAVLVSAYVHDSKSRDVYRFDTVTGMARNLTAAESPGFVSRWVVDIDGVPRAAVTADVDGDESAWYFRRSATDRWVKVDGAKLGEIQSTPMQFDGSGNILYVWARRNGEDRASIYEYTLDTGTWKKVVSQPQRDVRASFIDDPWAHKVLGLHYVADRPGGAWFDPEYERIQKAVDATLPGMVNSLQHRGERWIVVSQSDRNSGDVYLLDGRTMQMEKLLSYMPQIDPKVMAPMKWVRYQSREGLTVPALLTIPNSAHGKPVPLVVDIHGGPNVAANVWGFDREVQFFASRGYAVLQPQFRGTEGFGWRFESAGFRHCGATMQDDLADGVKWAVAQGIADPSRVCFYGVSYGGYAAAWASIRNSDLIKCAVVYEGITSIDYLFDNAQARYSRIAEEDSVMVDEIGDPKTERARFKSVSPLDHANEVAVPLLLAYGASDRQVPIVHGIDFRAALDKYHKRYEWVVYANEGHGFTKDEDIFDFYGRVERFLGEYLGGIVTSGKPEGAESH